MKTKLFFGQSIAIGAEKAVKDLNDAMSRWFDKNQVTISNVQVSFKCLASQVRKEDDLVFVYITVKVNYEEKKFAPGERLYMFFGQSMDNGAAGAIPYLERTYEPWRRSDGVEELGSFLETAPVALLCKGVAKVYYYFVLLVQFLA